MTNEERIQQKLILPLQLPWIEYKVEGLRIRIEPVLPWSYLAKKGTTHVAKMEIGLLREEEHVQKTKEQIREVSKKISVALIESRAVSSVLSTAKNREEETKMRNSFLRRVSKEIERELSQELFGKKELDKVAGALRSWHNIEFLISHPKEHKKANKELLTEVLRSLAEPSTSSSHTDTFTDIFQKRKKSTERIKINLGETWGGTELTLNLHFIYEIGKTRLGGIPLKVAEMLEENGKPRVQKEVKIEENGDLGPRFSVALGNHDGHRPEEGEKLKEEFGSVKIQMDLLIASIDLYRRDVYGKTGQEIYNVRFENKCAISAVDKHWLEKVKKKKWFFLSFGRIEEKRGKVALEEAEWNKRRRREKEEVTTSERIARGWKIARWLILGEEPPQDVADLCIMGKRLSIIKEMAGEKDEEKADFLKGILGDKLARVVFSSTEGLDSNNVLMYFIRFDQVERYKTPYKVGLFSSESIMLVPLEDTPLEGYQTLEDSVDLEVFVRLPGFEGIPKDLS